MRIDKSFKAGRSTFISLIAVCGALALLQQSHAQPDRHAATANIRFVDDDDDYRAKRDLAEVVDDAYVYYLTQVKGFDPHSNGISQVKQQAAAHAAKLDALLKANPQYHTRKLGTILPQRIGADDRWRTAGQSQPR